MESLTSGTMAGTGSFRCGHCGYVLTLAGTDTLSECPGCGGHDFVRASLFSAGGLARGRITGPPRSALSGAGDPIRAGRMGAGKASATGDSGERVSYADTLRTGAARRRIAFAPGARGQRRVAASTRASS